MEMKVGMAQLKLNVSKVKVTVVLILRAGLVMMDGVPRQRSGARINLNRDLS